MTITLRKKPNPKPTRPGQKTQPFNFSFRRKTFEWHPGDFICTLGLRTSVMGIINVTPDSFSQDGIFRDDYVAHAVRQAEAMIAAGADILDIGGESSRPGATMLSPEEERKRVIPVLEALAKRVDLPLSVDTYKPEVARAALEAGASIVNNIKGTQLDEALLQCLRKTQAGIILMHMYGAPETMQETFSYNDCVGEIRAALKSAIQQCAAGGIAAEKIVVDPGVGFGKSVQHNLQILNRLAELEELNRPVLIGTSRKSFIGHILNKDVQGRLSGSLASACVAVMHGAHILRVHDVGATREAVDMLDAITREGIL